VAISVMPPMPTEWWLRPVSSACRVGEQRAVVWNRLYRRPLAASRSKVGVLIGPPKALEAPNPQSSTSTTRMLGAPWGGRSGSIGGNDVSGSFASYVTGPARSSSAIGSTARRALSMSAMSVPLRRRGHAHAWRAGRTPLSVAPRIAMSGADRAFRAADARRARTNGHRRRTGRDST
jgi:hypothetical protein